MCSEGDTPPQLLIHKLVTAVVTGEVRRRVHGKGTGQGEPYKGQ